MTERQCPVCKLALVEGCQNGVGEPPYTGGGIIRVIKDGEPYVKTCPNMKRLRIRRHLESIDPQLVQDGVKHDKNSPLFQPRTDSTALVDLTRENLFIRSIKWSAFLPHLKWVSACKGVEFYVRILTDMTLLNVYVGNTNYKLRPQSQREDGSLLIANSIEDLLSTPDLAIIRLGQVVHYNKAAANVLAETLALRFNLGKPTWLIEPADRKFSPYARNDFGVSIGMVSCNEETQDFVSKNYKSLKLTTSVKVVEPSAGGVVEDEESGTVSLSDEGFSELNEASGEDVLTVEDDPAPEEEDFGELSVDDLWSESKAKNKKKFRKGGWSR